MVFGWMQLATAGEPPPGWHQDIPTGPVSIEGVPVSGHLDVVSVADVVQAITAFRDDGLGDPASLTVLEKGFMRGYAKNRDEGWYTVEGGEGACEWPDRTRHTCWGAEGQGLPEFIEAMHCIQEAKQVYVFPVANSREPHLDAKHLRLLDAKASSKLINLLGSKANWLVGFNDLMYPHDSPRDVGFVFQNGNDRVILFLFYDTVSGTYNDEHLSGTLLLGEVDKEMEIWKRQYAQRELKQN